MQQGGGGGSQSQYGLSPEQAVEAASPISSRPPAASGNLEELLPDALAVAGAAGDEADRGGGGGSGGGNRWPRQETLALLKIRSEMDAAFRDANVKGPLWDDISRKLAELGFKRSAKKCKEKFENVHKYYKRTKEGRAGRQDGKSYKFFSELEALHTATTSAAVTTTAAVENLAPAASVSFGIGIGGNPMPIPISSARIPSSSIFPPLDVSSSAMAAAAPPPPPAPTFGISFSSNSSSSSDDGDGDSEPSNTAGSSRKRKRGSGSSGSNAGRMMEFFEGLMNKVMQKQEAMQQRFIEAIEKREQDRMIREEAWRRQEIARLTREQEIMAQERAISVSRDSAIISFLQKITGQTIHFPPPPPPPPQPSVPSAPITTATSTPSQPQQQRIHRHRQTQNAEDAIAIYQPSISSAAVVMAVPEQQVPPQETGGGGGSFEPVSSRWPKAEVLALIKLRSGLESRYEEAGPKGPLWEEISGRMEQMGYRRSAKRCKEKWENINKYFKKVKESNKKRPEDAKTCPYFHELDALYRKKILGSGSSSFGDQHRPEEQQQQHPMHSTKVQDSGDVAMVMAESQSREGVEIENKNGGGADAQASNVDFASLFGEGGGGATKKPEDIVKEQQHQHQQQLLVNGFDKIEELDSDHGIDLEEDEDYDEDDAEDDEDDEEEEESTKMAFKIEFQRQNAGGSSNGGGNGAPNSFLAMVQ